MKVLQQLTFITLFVEGGLFFISFRKSSLKLHELNGFLGQLKMLRFGPQ